MRLIVMLLFCLMFCSACFPFGKKIRKDSQAFEKTHPEGFKTLQCKGWNLHYAVSGLQRGPLVIFIHGSPGSWDAFASYLMDPDLNLHARLVAVDRPGFGESDPGSVDRSLQNQAEIIAQVILTEGNGKGAIVVGHSLGGPVAARLAMDFPGRVSGLVLLAPSIDPNMEQTKWFQIPAQWFWVRWMLPSALDICNQEILPLKGELEKMLPFWKELRIPVRLIQGMDDGLVPPENADFAEKEMINADLKVTRVVGLNHFIPWARPDLVKAAVLGLLQASAEVPKAVSP